MKFLCVIGLLLSSVAFAGTTHIVLEAKNTASLREEYTSSSVNVLKKKLIDLDQNLGNGERIYLYLDTPGGSVVDGKELLEVIHGLRHKVDVIANFAASMGYLTTQGTTGKRYVTPMGILMAHRATMSSEGTVPGNFETRAEFFKQMIGNLSVMAAERVGITTSAYQTLVREEYWVMGADAVKAKHADGVASVECSSDLAGTYTESIDTLFGPVGIVWANCPLVSQPLAIDFSGIKFSFDSSATDNFQQVVTRALSHKQDIISSPALEEQYLKYVQ